MKTIEYKKIFLDQMRANGVLYSEAVLFLESQIDCYGYSDHPEDDGQEAFYTLMDMQ